MAEARRSASSHHEFGGRDALVRTAVAPTAEPTQVERDAGDQIPAQLLPPAEIGTAQQEIPVTSLEFSQEEIALLEFTLWEAKRQLIERDNLSYYLGLVKLWAKVRSHLTEEDFFMTC